MFPVRLPVAQVSVRGGGALAVQQPLMARPRLHPGRGRAQLVAPGGDVQGARLSATALRGQVQEPRNNHRQGEEIRVETRNPIFTSLFTT